MKKLILAVLFAFVVLASFVAASDSYEITKVGVNGIEPSEDGQVQVELGTTAQVVVYLEGTGDTTDVKVRAWMGGYEYGNLEVFSEMFDVEDGVSYKKTLLLEIPADLEVTDHDYTLYVEIYDDTDSEMVSYSLYMEEPRHSVNIKEILLSSSSVDSGDYLGVRVRLENLGENDEDDLRITAYLEGVSTVAYVEELDAKGGEDDEVSSQTLYLTVPDGLSGDYELTVQVEYDNGYTTVEKTTWVRVNGTTAIDDDALVSISSVTGLQVGKESEFKVQITNLGETREFNLFVYGVEDVDYTESVTVVEDRTGELTFSITPTEEGMQEVVVEVSTADGLVEQRVFNVDVESKNNFWLILGSVLVVFIFALLVVLHLKRL